jgi:hypothetical protein
MGEMRCKRQPTKDFRYIFGLCVIFCIFAPSFNQLHHIGKTMISTPHNTGKHNCFNYLAALISVLFGILLSEVYLGADDLWFINGTAGMSPGVECFKFACANMADRFQTDTARLGNLINPIFLALLPKAVFNVISALALYLLITQSVTLAKLRDAQKTVYRYYLLALIIFALPWYDYMLFVTFTINYIWSAALIVTAANIIVGNVSLRTHAAEYALCFVAGWMHEGFGVPLCFAATIYLIVTKQFGNKRSLCHWFALGFGSAMTFMSPALWHRAGGGSTSIFNFPTREAIMQLGPALSVFALFVIAATIFAARKNGRSYIWFIGTYTIVALMVFLKFYCGPRTGMPLILFSSIGAVYALSSILQHNKIASRIIAIIIAITTTANMVAACVAQHSISDERTVITELYEKSASGTIYCDITYPTLDASLFKTTVREMHDQIPRHQFSLFHGGKSLVILPSSMNGFSDEKGIASKLSPNVLIYNSNIIIAEDAEISGSTIVVCTAAGGEIASRYRLDKFTDERGKTHYLVVPHCKTLNPQLAVSDVKIEFSQR